MNKKLHSRRILPLLGTVCLFAFSPVQAQVSGWAAQGFTSGTVTEGAPGDFTAAPAGNLSPRALLTPIAFTANGTTVTLTGTAAITNAAGNIQFRFGLYDTNGSADAAGWLGYWASHRAFGGTGGSVLNGRTGLGTGVFVSGTGSYGVAADTLSETGTSGAGGTFDFSLTLTRVDAATIGASYSFVQSAGGGTINISGAYTDTGASASLSAINAVGFLVNNDTGGISFSDVTVSAIPEPSTYAALAGGLMLGVAALKRRRRAV